MMESTTEYFVESRDTALHEGWHRIFVAHPSFGKALDHIVRLREAFPREGQQYQVRMIHHEEGILWSTEDEVLESS